ncbi:response regulator [Alloscardovia venturai]|uniref:Response regulator n=1 Tax=Alloscardovia venturai TaxID=1769421 RepID=A0ABW2Y2C3_9BIFI
MTREQVLDVTGDGSDEKQLIMIVDDDPVLSEMLSIILEDNGYISRQCHDGVTALELVPFIKPSLVLLDVMLPGLNGVQVAQRIRRLSSVPIIMLTAKADTADIVEGLDAGADDYVTKPFQSAELIARIRTHLRNANKTAVRVTRDGTMPHIECGDFIIDAPMHTVTKNGKNISLTPIEFNLLQLLAAHEGEVLSRDFLLRTVWEYENSSDSRTVNVCIQRLRQRIEDNPENPQYILTVRGVGYKFCAQPRMQVGND